MEIKELKTLGLTNGETKVYSAILYTGISSVNNIHEKTGMERRAIYDIINKLIEKGLITYTFEKGRRTYQCAPPSKLKEEFNRRKKELEKFEKVMPNIEGIYKAKKPKISSEVFRGIEGIKAVFEDLLNYKKIRFIGGGWYMMKEIPFFWPNYNKRRIKADSKWYNLIRYELRKTRAPKEKVYTKYLPKEFSGDPTVVFIYGNKVVHVTWGLELFAFMIENKEIANSYKNYHKYLWNNVAKST